jgi:hypothetical protein
MNSPIRFRVDGSDGVRVTVGPVWAELDRAEALEMWRALGQELGMMCDSHRLTGKVVPASTCSRCEQLIAVVDNS